MKNLRLLWISIQGVVFFILFCLACPVWGQVTEKKDLTPEDFGQWHHLFNPKISDNGKWASFLLSYEKAEDTLVLQNTENKTKIYLPNGTEEHFFGNKWFVYKKGSSLKAFDLEQGTTHNIPDVVDYSLTPDNEYLISLSVKVIDGEKSERKLQLLKLGAETRFKINNVEDFALNERGDFLAYTIKEAEKWSLKVIEIKKSNNPKTLLSGNKGPFRRMVWGPKNDLAFLENSDDGNSNKVFWFKDVKQNLAPRIFDANTRMDIDRGLVVLDNPSTFLRFSDDGERLFFHLKKRPYTSQRDNHGSTVQVWNAKDKLIYPVYNGNEDFFKDPPFMVCWNGESDAIYSMGDNESSRGLFIDSADYLFTHSLLDDMLAYDDGRADTPINVYNLKNGSKRFVMWRKPYMPIKVSPSGKYLAYFDEKDWWVYDAEKNTHTNITKNIAATFKDEAYDWAGVVPSYGLAGWTAKDSTVLLYDKYDLWEITLDGAKAKRLTQGRENNKTYRAINTGEYVSTGDGYLMGIINLEKGITLLAEDWNGKTGYYFMSRGSNLKPIVEVDAKVDWIQKSKNTDAFLYTIEKFDLPPKLILTDIRKQVSMDLHSSNPQQENYKWGKSELVKYSISEKGNLKGALFYPADFDPQKRYPMVVFIYERMSGTLNKYENPTMFTGADINITNLTLRGYFVFCPDIVYKINEVGKSALECVEAGVAAVLKTAPVDKSRIGLFGHSFGGYQTSFIIGNTDIFATAISASAIHDLKSFYFSIAWLWDLPQTARFLNSQLRFNETYFKIPLLYQKNSPINYAPFISTPLLTITGEKDTNINWEQSIEMYNALRILNKEHIMLFYPNEGHDFYKEENQIDMTHKRWQWFDHYLKREPAKPWMKEFK
ncbi:alpha/beta hydrolase family protein [Aequorivita flava]|uniref:Prolyl oligopeptidase family serine peptidase n=1 Tax=Aequorivita flava TaxID=3114371 RepID=A0AB35YUL9_9FLAO